MKSLAISERQFDCSLYKKQPDSLRAHRGGTGTRELTRNRGKSALRRREMMISQKEKKGSLSQVSIFQSSEELQLKKTKAEWLTKGSGGSSSNSFYFFHFAYFTRMLFSGRNPWVQFRANESCYSLKTSPIKKPSLYKIISTYLSRVKKMAGCCRSARSHVTRKNRSLSSEHLSALIVQYITAIFAWFSWMWNVFKCQPCCNGNVLSCRTFNSVRLKGHSCVSTVIFYLFIYFLFSLLFPCRSRAQLAVETSPNANWELKQDNVRLWCVTSWSDMRAMWAREDFTLQGEKKTKNIMHSFNVRRLGEQRSCVA